MMRNNNIRMKTRVPVGELLSILRTNLATHKKIVAEAKIGYLNSAIETLQRNLEYLKNDRKVASLSINMQPPQDHSDVYKTTIKMLEMTTDKEIVLEADEFRQL